MIKTEAEHIGDHCGLETETEESGEESEAEDRLKTEAEGGKEASNTKPPFSYVAMIGESSDAKKGLFLKSQKTSTCALRSVVARSLRLGELKK